MKYENAVKALNLVQKIEKEIELLKELSNDNLNVIISTSNNYKITTIGCDSPEHLFGIYAKEMVKRCRAEVELRINNLKAELDCL